MKWYRVTFGYRTDGGLIYSKPTAFATVIVRAENPGEARLAAIDRAYEADSSRSHATPTVVEERADDTGEWARV